MEIEDKPAIANVTSKPATGDGAPGAAATGDGTSGAVVVGAGAAVTTPSMEAMRQYASAGWQGLFRISTRLLREKEIDIDDREAVILFTLEMKTIRPWELKIENLEVVLKLTNGEPNQNISINGKTTGDLVLFDQKDAHRLFPGAALHKELTVKTGAFSSDNLKSLPAIRGLKRYNVEISYRLVPITSTTDNVMKTKLVFYIADD